MPNVSAAAFWLEKGGNSAAEYEDAFALDTVPHADDSLSFAVADGASEGMLSGPWANVAARTYCRLAPATGELGGYLARCLHVWARWRSGYLRRREQHGRPVQWYEEDGLERGAFTSLVGLTLRDDGVPTWEAVALGDTCLALVRDDEVVTAFPIDTPEGFTSRPLLLASNPAHNGAVFEAIQVAGGECRPGDCFYLMTDALALWFIREWTTGAAPWTKLNRFAKGENGVFQAWVGELRAAGAMRNDDVTLLRLAVK